MEEEGRPCKIQRRSSTGAKVSGCVCGTTPCLHGRTLGVAAADKDNAVVAATFKQWLNSDCERTSHLSDINQAAVDSLNDKDRIRTSFWMHPGHCGQQRPDSAGQPGQMASRSLRCADLVAILEDRAAQRALHPRLEPINGAQPGVSPAIFRDE